MTTPVSTYRLQVTPDFDLHAVAELVDYLHALGVHWLYLSPLLRSEPGSAHGYDVIDHAEVDDARGGLEGLVGAATAAHGSGMGVLVDIVPNHVGVATPMASVWWRDMLANGPSSRYAEAFDVDWEFGNGRVRIPVLGDEADPELEVVGDTLRYGALEFPLRSDRPDLEGRPADEVHAGQHYELVNWRRADHELNYRRFFAVNTLAAVRVEVPWVFAESHAEILRWIDDGLVDGLRVDHPDGLADPGGYLDALAAATDGRYVLVEKILHRGEPLPAAWATHGTTGYDALAEFDRVLVDPAGATALDALDARLRDPDEPDTWDELIHTTKRAVADGILRSEVRRIVRELPDELTRPADLMEDAVAELLTCFPVYRSYLPAGREHLDAALADARRHRPDLAEPLADVAAVLADPTAPAAQRFQQTSGMVMAKGVEDTAFYRYNRLGSLTEVGGDPAHFADGIAEFHELQQRRLATWPAAMTTLSTHDTKRGEDVRARLHVLSELPDEWAAFLDAVRAAAPTGDGGFDELLWQAVVGAWPVGRGRLHAYAEKAAREAGRSTSWPAPDEAFERMMHAAVDAAFDDPHVAELVGQFVDRVAGPGWSNALAAKLLQLTGPGVPDVYQGSELWETSLVDPDNRRPVDFAERRRLLAELDAGTLPPVDATGAAKLHVTSRALRLRREHPEWFSRYRPLDVIGPAGEHVVAVDRGAVVVAAVRLPVGLARRGGWGDTTISTPRGPKVDVLTGREFAPGPIPAATLFSPYPVALLVGAPAGG